MIVRLTNRQRSRVFDLVTKRGGMVGSRLGAFDVWWDRDATIASKHRVDTSMPAAAWRMVEEVLFDHCFNERGFRMRDVKTTDLNALKAVRRALNVRESHPAMYRRGAIGYINELIPAWRFPGPDGSGRFYTPYPMPDAEFVVLAPETRVVKLQTTTLWVEATRLPERPILCEAEHLKFRS